MFNKTIKRQLPSILSSNRPAVFRNAIGTKIDTGRVVDAVDSVFENGQKVITDCDECIVTEDLGKLHFQKLFQNRDNFKISDEKVFEEILIPEHFRSSLYELEKLNSKLAQEYSTLKQMVIKSYFQAKYGISHPQEFIDLMLEFDTKTFKVEAFLRENSTLGTHTGIKNYLLIRCRLYHAMDLNILNDSYNHLVRYNNIGPINFQYSSPKTLIYDTLNRASGKPIICSTNLLGIVNSNFDLSFAEHINGTQYGECIETNTFVGRLNTEPVFKDEKTNIVLRNLGLPETDSQASETIGFMAGDSASNDLPTMLSALTGNKGYAMVRIKGEPFDYYSNINDWTDKFRKAGIDDETILKRVFFVDER